MSKRGRRHHDGEDSKDSDFRFLIFVGSVRGMLPTEARLRAAPEHLWKYELRVFCGIREIRGNLICA